MALPQNFDLDRFVKDVLAEDLGTGRDVTSAATIAADACFTSEMNARQPIVVAGIDVAAAFFRALDSQVEIETLAADGDRVGAGSVLLRPRVSQVFARLSGSPRSSETRWARILVELQLLTPR